MDFVAFIGKDKENWGQITALIKRLNAERIFLLKNKEINDFPSILNCEIIEVDSSLPLIELKKEIKEILKSRIGNEIDVSLSLASGNGKEHMALISALLSIPVGIRFVIFTRNGVEFLN